MSKNIPLVYEKLPEYSIDDWVDEFHDIYRLINDTRDIAGIWLHAIEHASRLHEHLRLWRYTNALNELNETN